MVAGDAYAELIRRSKELAVLNSCAAVLSWDQQTYMPARGAGLRGVLVPGRHEAVELANEVELLALLRRHCVLPGRNGSGFGSMFHWHPLFTT